MNATAPSSTKSHYDVMNHPAWQNLMKKYFIKIVESWQGMEGSGMNAELYHRSDKRKIADIHNAGNGGCLHFTYFGANGKPQFIPDPGFDAFLSEVKTLPLDEEFGGTPMTVSEEVAIGVLASMADCAAMVKRSRKQRFLVVTPEMGDGEFLQYDFPKGTALEVAKASITKRQPDALVINEFF